MKTAVVLHLTDLHFGWEERTSSENESRRAARKNCLDSLVEHLGRVADREADWRPTMVAVTGDIGWKGLESDYQQAREWVGAAPDSFPLLTDPMRRRPSCSGLDVAVRERAPQHRSRSAGCRIGSNWAVAGLGVGHNGRLTGRTPTQAHAAGHWPVLLDRCL